MSELPRCNSNAKPVVCGEILVKLKIERSSVDDGERNAATGEEGRAKHSEAMARTTRARRIEDFIL